MRLHLRQMTLVPLTGSTLLPPMALVPLVMSGVWIKHTKIREQSFRRVITYVVTLFIGHYPLTFYYILQSTWKKVYFLSVQWSFIFVTGLFGTTCLDTALSRYVQFSDPAHKFCKEELIWHPLILSLVLRKNVWA